MKRFVYLLLICSVLTSCGMLESVTRESQYAKMYEEKPITLLVMPPINNSANVEAKDLLYTSISRPLVEAGYYVFSPLLAMDILRQRVRMMPKTSSMLLLLHSTIISVPMLLSFLLLTSGLKRAWEYRRI